MTKDENDRLEKVEERLVEVEKGVVAIQTTLNINHQALHDKVMEHDVELNGRGKNEPGLKTRVGDLEGFQSRVGKKVGAAWAAILAIGTTVLGAILGWALKGGGGGAEIVDAAKDVVK